MRRQLLASLAIHAVALTASLVAHADLCLSGSPGVAPCVTGNQCQCSTVPIGCIPPANCTQGCQGESAPQSTIFEIPIAPLQGTTVYDLGVADQSGHPQECSTSYLCHPVGDVANDGIADLGMDLLFVDTSTREWMVQTQDFGGNNGPAEGFTFKVRCDPGYLDISGESLSSLVTVDAPAGSNTPECETLSPFGEVVPYITGRVGVPGVGNGSGWVQWVSPSDVWQVCAFSYSGSSDDYHAYAYAYSPIVAPKWGVETGTETFSAALLDGSGTAQLCVPFVQASASYSIDWNAPGGSPELQPAPSPQTSSAACALNL